MEASFIVRNWVSTLIKGVIGIAFGIILLLWPRDTIEALLIIFGIFALLIGIIFAVAFFMELFRKESWGFYLGVALVSVYLGILSIARTEVSAVVFLFLMVAWLLARGIFEITIGTWMGPEFKYRWLLILEGVLAIIVALSLMLFTAPTLKLLVFLFGTYIILMGVLDVIVSFMLRSYYKAGGPKQVVVSVE